MEKLCDVRWQNSTEMGEKNCDMGWKNNTEGWQRRTNVEKLEPSRIREGWENCDLRMLSGSKMENE